MITSHPCKRIAYLNSYDGVDLDLCRPEAGVLEVQIVTVDAGRAQVLRVMVGDRMVHEGAVNERA